ncbi:hypothetical protein C8J57DRAFT_1723994 [Mycena rebaudengoi]|nr:hypothetical protein C8J57DRAFT_1723994 [Mycena rebaudengoi]
MPGSTLPPFDPTNSKYTQPPNPSWTYGQAITATREGAEWAEQEKEGWKTIKASEEDPRRLYSLLTTAIVPRPVAFVSSISEDDTANLAPFSWFNQVSANPPVISISCTYTPRQKDTAANIKATKGFTVNIISTPWIEQANFCAVDAPPGVSEWDLSGLTKEPSTLVKAPRVKESAFTLECELLQTVEIKKPDGTMAATLILGAVKCIHVRKAVLNERGVVDPAKFKPIGRMGGTTYVRLGDAFDLARGSWSDVATAAL